MTAPLAQVTDPAQRAALADLLVRTADDELIIGHRHSEWTGFGVDLESDIAFSSIAQDEIGHARLLYELAGGLGLPTPDRLAFGRTPEEYRNAVLVERENGDWGESIVRLALYEIADEVRLEAFAASRLRPLADVARTLAREETYHRLFADAWLARLASAGEDARRRTQAAVETLYPLALALFDPGDADAALGDLLPLPGAAMRETWARHAGDALGALGLRVPGEAAAPGRRGDHSTALRALWEEMTSVYRLDPEATW